MGDDGVIKDRSRGGGVGWRKENQSGGVQGRRRGEKEMGKKRPRLSFYMGNGSGGLWRASVGE